MPPKRKPKPETEAGQAFARDLAKIDGARKAKQTRARKRAEETDAFWRDHYHVEHNGERIHWFDAEMPSDPPPDWPRTVEEWIMDVIQEFNLAGKDLAVWRDRRLAAVVRTGADGKPEIIRFGNL